MRWRRREVSEWSRGRGAQVVSGELPEGYVPPSASLTPPVSEDGHRPAWCTCDYSGGMCDGHVDQWGRS